MRAGVDKFCFVLIMVKYQDLMDTRGFIHFTRVNSLVLEQFYDCYNTSLVTLDNWAKNP